MNIFRLLGECGQIAGTSGPDDLLADFSHLASIFVLLQKMKSSSVRAPIWDLLRVN